MTANARDLQKEHEQIVITVLEKASPGKWVSAYEIGKRAGLPRQSVIYALRRLRYSRCQELHERDGFYVDGNRREKRHKLFRLEAVLETKNWPKWMTHGSFGEGMTSVAFKRVEEVIG